MKTKTQFINRVLSLVLALVMVVGLLPSFTLTANAATEVPELSKLQAITYKDGATQYFKYDNYLYKVKYTNSQNISTIFLKIRGQNLMYDHDGTVTNLMNEAKNGYIKITNLPKSIGVNLSCYSNSPIRVIDTNSPVVIISCVGVDNPSWDWSEPSVPTATFTATNTDVCATVNASISSETVTATNCLSKDQTTYTASVTFNGQIYTDTHTVYGDPGPHSYAYSASRDTVTEKCANCNDHNETAQLVLDETVSRKYTGSEIKPLKVEYSDGWQGGTLDIAYQNNTAVSTDASKASGSITKNGKTATQNFTITKATMSGISVNGYSSVYDGKEHSISITNVPSNATVKYSTSENGTYTTTNPSYTEKGTYEVWYKIEKENYETVSGSASVVISQATNSWTTEPSIDGWNYGETAKTPIAASQFGTVKVDYRLVTETDADYTITIPTEVGNYLVRFSVEGNENYASLSKVVELEIAQVKLTVTADNKSKTYGESDPTLTWQITEGKLVGTEELENISISRADGKDADSYAITVSQTEGANPNYDITFESGTFTINQKEVDISWDPTMHLPYNGSSLVPKANVANLEAGDECILTTEVVETEDGAGIIPGTWTAKVVSLSNSNYKLPESGVRVTATFEVVNGYQNYAPDVTAVNETINGKNDGKITGVDSTMEYRKDGESTYTAITGTEVTGLADGTYYVRYAAKNYYNPSPEKQVTISAGRMLTVTVPQNQVGYTLTVDKTEFEYMGGPKITLIIAEGYSKGDNFAVKLNGKDMQWGDFTSIETQSCMEDLVITVEGVVDKTDPVVEIDVKGNKWTEFWNNLTFGLFFKETQDVTITAADSGSGVKSIEYYLSSREMERDELRTVTDWQPYNGTFKINPNNRYVVYAKVVDIAGNTVYVNSDGLTLDNVAPTLAGIENGKIYYGDLTVIKPDEQIYDIKIVTLDGEPMGFEEGTYGRIPADNAEHTVVVEDHAGNKTTYTVTVMKNYTVTYKVDGVVVDTQTVGHGKDATAPTIPAKDGYTQTAPTWDKDGKNITADTEINAVYTINKYTVTYKADGEVVGTVTIEHGKDATAPTIPEKEGYTQTAPTWDNDGKNITADIEINAVYTINKYTVTYKADGEVVNTVEVEHGGDSETPAVPAKNGYVGKWDAVGKDITKDTTISAVYTAILDVDADEVKPEDKSELEDTKKQLEDMLEDDSYTEDDKKVIQDAIDDIDDALEVIGNVEAVEELIDKLPDTIKKDDEAAIKAADDAYNALTDYEKSLVDAEAKNALDDAKAALAELNKPADPNSPATGDNSNMMLWIALLFISGGAVITLTVVDRKRKAVKR